jgi:uncharacterized protein YvpB
MIKYSIVACIGTVIIIIVFLSKTYFGEIAANTTAQIEEKNTSPEIEISSNNSLKVASVPTDEEKKKVVSPPQKVSTEENILPNEIIIDVPLINQMEAPRLYNGCEVTSLTMLLHYSGIQVSKNELAAKITRVPLQLKDGKNGNPNIGFVGNMEDGPGLGVYHEPIFKLAQKYVPDQAEDLSNQPFLAIIEKVAKGLPVWVITTTSFSPTTEMKTWNTPQGPVDITFKMHSVVITGFDQESLYINDPYGTKNKKVNKENFIKAWEQMGSQAMVINKKSIYPNKHNTTVQQ